ncbi:MAG: DUF3995 domain-containing protein [Saprospiraceae bacterium]|nr:DUF3995 domain-containing protein [Saprospiraceae bacterium]
MMILAIILFVIFSILGAFHLYWLAGGSWGMEYVIPTKDDTTQRLTPPAFATLIVAVALFSFGLVYLQLTELIYLPVPDWIINYAAWFIPSIFILRAIGEFNYVGFFKRIRHTKFAKADSKLFSPLCLGIGGIGIIIQLTVG